MSTLNSDLSPFSRVKKPFFLITFLFAVLPVGLRFQLYQLRIVEELATAAWGGLADLWWSGFLALLLVWLSPRLRVLSLLLFLSWLTLHLVDRENILALGQPAHHSNLPYLLQVDFLRNTLGSMPLVKSLATAVLIGALALAFWSTYPRLQQFRNEMRPALTLAGLIVGAVCLISLSPGSSVQWQARNLLAHHLDEIISEILWQPQPPDKMSELLDHAIFQEDLTADRPDIGQARNVLLIAVEGLQVHTLRQSPTIWATART